MIEILKSTKELIFEKNNSFKNGTGPCYYKKNHNGYVVFFEFKGGLVDFAVYNEEKKLISLIISVDQSIREDRQEQFIYYSIKNRF